MQIEHSLKLQGPHSYKQLEKIIILVKCLYLRKEHQNDISNEIFESRSRSTHIGRFFVGIQIFKYKAKFKQVRQSFLA